MENCIWSKGTQTLNCEVANSNYWTVTVKWNWDLYEENLRWSKKPRSRERGATTWSTGSKTETENDRRKDPLAAWKEVVPNLPRICDWAWMDREGAKRIWPQPTLLQSDPRDQPPTNYLHRDVQNQDWTFSEMLLKYLYFQEETVNLAGNNKVDQVVETLLRRAGVRLSCKIKCNFSPN